MSVDILEDARSAVTAVDMVRYGLQITLGVSRCHYRDGYKVEPRSVRSAAPYLTVNMGALFYRRDQVRSVEYIAAAVDNVSLGLGPEH